MFNLNSVPTVFESLYIKKINNFNLLYNPLSEKGMTLLNKNAYKLFLRIDGAQTIEDYIEQGDNLSIQLKKEEILKIFQNLHKHDIVNFSGKKNAALNKKEKKKTSLEIWLDITEQCNFRCTYCFVDKHPKRMTEETMEKVIDTLYDLKQKHGYGQIQLFMAGGEPLSEFHLIKKIVEKVRKIEAKHKPAFYLKIITNGSLLTEEIAKYLRDNNVRISISLDGIGDVHDQTRRLPNGSGTFKYVQRGLSIAKKYNILNNIGAVITLKNINTIHQLAKYCLKNNIVMCLGFFKKCNNLCDERTINNDKSIIPGYKRMLKTIYSYYEEQKMETSPLFDHYLLDGLKYPMIRSGQSCGAGEVYFSISTEGKVRFCPTSTLEIGTITGMDFILKARNNKSLSIFQKASIEKIPECKKCTWKYLCAGGCGIERYYLNNGTNKPSPKCSIYKSLITTVLDLEAKRIIRTNLLSKISK